MIPGKKYTPEDVLEAAWRRRWLIVIPLVLISAVGVWLARRLPSVYRSDAVVQVIPPTVPDSYLRPTVQARIEERLPSIFQQVVTRPQIERIIRELDLYQQDRGTVALENLVDRVGRDITFEPVNRETFKFGYTSPDPNTAYQVTKRLTSLFIDGNAKDREDQANAARDFFQTELEKARQHLVGQENKLEEFRTKYAGQLPSQQDANLQVLNSTQVQLQTLLESINRDRDQRQYQQRQKDQAGAPDAAPASSSASPSADPSNIGGGTVAEQLESARTSLRTQELRLTPDHPDVKSLKRTIERLEAKASAEGRMANGSTRALKTSAELQRDARTRELNAQIELIDRQIANKRAEEQRLRATIAEYRERIEAAPRRESELTSLTRDYDTLQKMYSTLLTKEGDAKMAASLEQRDVGERFKVIDPARLPGSPASPNRMRLYVLSLLVGLVMSFGVGAFFEYRDSSLRTDDDVAASLGLPVLATIPVLSSASGGWGRTAVLLTVAAGGFAPITTLAWTLAT